MVACLQVMLIMKIKEERASRKQSREFRSIIEMPLQDYIIKEKKFYSLNKHLRKPYISQANPQINLHSDSALHIIEMYAELRWIFWVHMKGQGTHEKGSLEACFKPEENHLEFKYCL